MLMFRALCAKTPLVQFVCLLSASIDPNRPYKLSPGRIQIPQLACHGLCTAGHSCHGAQPG